jgi:hypothetical protein
MYWASERNKLPDLVDFCVTKGIPQDFAVEPRKTTKLKQQTSHQPEINFKCFP